MIATKSKIITMKVVAAVVLAFTSAALCHGYEESFGLLELGSVEDWGQGEVDPWDSLLELGAEVQRAFTHAVGGEVRTDISDSVDSAVRLGMSLLGEARDAGEGMWEQISEEAERLANQLEEEMSRRVEAIESHAEAYTQEVRRKIDRNLLEIQRNTAPLAQTFQDQLTQTALNIRNSAEAFVGGFASLWESTLQLDKTG